LLDVINTDPQEIFIYLTENEPMPYMGLENSAF